MIQAEKIHVLTKTIYDEERNEVCEPGMTGRVRCGDRERSILWPLVRVIELGDQRDWKGEDETTLCGSAGHAGCLKRWSRLFGRTA